MKVKLLLVACLAVGCLAAPSKDDGTQTGDDSGKTNSHWYDGILNFFKDNFPGVGFGSHGKLTNYPNGNQNKVGANQKLTLDFGENAGTLDLDYRREKKSDSDWLGVGYKYPIDNNGHYAYVKVENNLEEGNSSFIWDLDSSYDKLKRAADDKKKEAEDKRRKEEDEKEKKREEANTLKENQLRSWENSLAQERLQYDSCVNTLNNGVEECVGKPKVTGTCFSEATGVYNTCMKGVKLARNPIENNIHPKSKM